MEKQQQLLREEDCVSERNCRESILVIPKLMRPTPRVSKSWKAHLNRLSGVHKSSSKSLNSSSVMYLYRKKKEEVIKSNVALFNDRQAALLYPSLFKSTALAKILSDSSSTFFSDMTPRYF